mmetsp:Transcript_25877/g.86099  ORF Transcript_25877/g.86099 Transcript_25877/m.86099 type:complete len:255 (+) Transcript_25877:173-937(+)
MLLRAKHAGDNLRGSGEEEHWLTTLVHQDDAPRGPLHPAKDAAHPRGCLDGPVHGASFGRPLVPLGRCPPRRGGHRPGPGHGLDLVGPPGRRGSRTPRRRHRAPPNGTAGCGAPGRGGAGGRAQAIRGGSHCRPPGTKPRPQQARDGDGDGDGRPRDAGRAGAFPGPLRRRGEGIESSEGLVESSDGRLQRCWCAQGPIDEDIADGSSGHVGPSQEGIDAKIFGERLVPGSRSGKWACAVSHGPRPRAALHRTF